MSGVYQSVSRNAEFAVSGGNSTGEGEDVGVMQLRSRKGDLYAVQWNPT